jgi:hypothetical protein
VLLQWFSWRSAFAVNVVLAAVAIAGAVAFVPESADPDAPRLDKAGAVLAVAALTALVFSIIEAPEAGWAGARTLGGIAGGLAILTVFVVWEVRAAHPMLDVRHFRSRRLSAGAVSIFIQFFAFFGFTFVCLQYLQGVRGESPLLAALSVLPLAGLIPLGAGMGAAMTPATAAITEGLPAAQQGVGSALNRPVSRGRRRAGHCRHRLRRHRRLPGQPGPGRRPGRAGEQGPRLVRPGHSRRRSGQGHRRQRLRRRHPHRAAVRRGRRRPRRDHRHRAAAR